MYRLELRPPVRINQSLEVQIRQVFSRTHIAECNSAFARLHGFDSAEELIGRPLLDIYGEGQDLAQLPVLRAIDHDYVMEGAQSCEIDQQGRERWFENTLQGIIENGRLVAFWGGQREVTHEKHAAYALRETDHRYGALMDMSPNLVMVHSEQAIEAINTAGAELLGGSAPDRVQGRPLTDFMGDAACDDLLRRAPQPDAASEATFHAYQIKPLHGAPIRMEMTSRHILWHGQPAVLTVAREWTPALLQGDGVAAGAVTFDEANTPDEVDDKRALKSAFKAGMDPDIRTPLTAMVGFAEILGDEINNPGQLDIHELVDRIRANGQQLLWMLDAISNQARLEAGTIDLHPCSFDVVREVEEIVETLDVVAHEKGLRVNLQAEQPAVYASLDRTAFERIAGHMIVHAIRASHEGTIDIQVRENDEGPVIAISGAYKAISPFLNVVQGAAQTAEAPRPPAACVVNQLLDRMGSHVTIGTSDAGCTCEIRFQTASDAPRPSQRLLSSQGAPAMSS
jgi:PAS domain S-box-containing protein